MREVHQEQSRSHIAEERRWKHVVIEVEQTQATTRGAKARPGALALGREACVMVCDCGDLLSRGLLRRASAAVPSDLRTIRTIAFQVTKKQPKTGLMISMSITKFMSTITLLPTLSMRPI